MREIFFGHDFVETFETNTRMR